MEALLARTAQTLRGRFETLRLGGAIPALMAETPREHPLPLRSDSGPRLPIFEWKYQPAPRWVCGAMVILDRQHVANRDVWLGAELNVGQAIRRVCREAASFVPFIRRHCGLPEECGTNDLEAIWIWTVLELAAVGVPGSLLKLDGRGVFRCAGSVVRATECDLARAALIPPTADDLVSQFLRMDFDPTRYWQLEDLVEASIQVMDVVEVAIASGASAPAGADVTDKPSIAPYSTLSVVQGRRKRRSTKAIDVDGPLGKVETKMRKVLVAELGSERAAEAALVDKLYTLSAENLEPMLRRVGCKADPRTIRRNSKKYEAWGRYRRPAAHVGPDVDVGPAALSDVRPRVADVADDAVNSGNLSKRAGGRGTTRIGKTAAEKAAEEAADRFAREAGVDLPTAE